jgi:radical SAM superfamily enzyme YgiQ (UPF0313 family)
MHYEGQHIIRPPSEANSIILQVTVGCSHNRCTFCATYKGLLFRIKEDQILDADLDFAGRHCKNLNRIFLADGNALIVPQKRLVALFQKIRQKLPGVNRISLYGNAKSIRAKSDAELVQLKQLGLDRVYMGLESGSDLVLDEIRKGADAAAMIEAGRRVRQAGLFLSVTVLLGIGGVTFSHEHAVTTGRVLSAMAPNQIGVLTLMILPGTPLYDRMTAGNFSLPDEHGLLRELRVMIEHINVERSQIQTNHASNYLPIDGRLPKDKNTILAQIDLALAGGIALKPEYMRAL